MSAILRDDPGPDSAQIEAREPLWWLYVLKDIIFLTVLNGHKTIYGFTAPIEFWASPAPIRPVVPVFWRKHRLFAAGVPRGTLVFAWSSQKVKTDLVLPALKQ